MAARKPQTSPDAPIDAYLASVPEPARTTLQKLRKTIQAAAPQATETISYSMPTFRQGALLVGFRHTPKHCAFHVMSNTVLRPLKKELTAFDTAIGTIRFPADKPLPAALVRKVVKARLAENATLAALKAKKGQAK